MKILRIHLAYMLFQLATSKYSYVTTLTASTPYMQDGFGSEFSLVVNGTMLILAAMFQMFFQIHMLKYSSPMIMDKRGYTHNLSRVARHHQVLRVNLLQLSVIMERHFL